MNDSIRSAAVDFKITHQEWREFFSSRVSARKSLVSGYLLYVEEMGSQNLPPIFEGRHLTELLGLSSVEFARLTRSPESNYREFEIPKRRGGMRTISVPSATMLECQQWVDWFILRKSDIHPSAHGYVTGKSNITNALVHLGKKEVLKLDIKDFFGSLGIGLVVRYFAGLGYPRKVAFLLSRLCTAYEQLPQGAASSPQLSNVLMFGIDKSLEAFASSNGLTYTRYVDDITLSGDKVSDKHIRQVASILSILDLELNEDKTIFQRGRKKIITGVSIGSGKPKLPRTMRRSYKNMAFHFLKNSENSNFSSRDPVYCERVLGRLTYWSAVEPENFQVRELIKRVQMTRLSVA